MSKHVRNWDRVSKFIRFKSIFTFKHERIDLHSQISSHVSISFLFQLQQLYGRQTSLILTRPSQMYFFHESIEEMLELVRGRFTDRVLYRGSTEAQTVDCTLW